MTDVIREGIRIDPTGAVYVTPSGSANITGGTISTGAAGLATLLGASSTSVSAPADTSEDTLATITLPANTLGANGCVRIRCFFSYTNNANNKTLKIKFGGTNVVTITRTTNISSLIDLIVGNAGATNSQNAYAFEVTGASGCGTQSNTATVDTTAAVTILITGQKATAGDTLTLVGYVAEAIH